MVYEPHEDSFLMQKHIYQYAHGSVLDMGTGTGILAREAVKYAEKVLAVDIDAQALKTARQLSAGISNIRFKHSDLFSKITGQFDLIIFNPPYLPYDSRAPDVALDGGTKGYEVIERFVQQASTYLKPEGNILLVFTSLTNKLKVDEIIHHHLFESELVDTDKYPFETAYVYRISKSYLLKELEKKGMTNVHYLAKGKRGIVYSAQYHKKNVVVKIKNPMATIDRLYNEAQFLSRLQKYSFVPRLYSATEEIIVMEHIEGKEIFDFLETASKKEILMVLKKIIDACLILDKLKITKEEMHHPVKHIIVDSKLRVVFIDFERCHYDDKPKNVTQFCQFLAKDAVIGLLNKKGIILYRNILLAAAKKYRHGNNIPKLLN